jgi:glycosyltransferase involved in cell wall biosynthesis
MWPLDGIPKLRYVLWGLQARNLIRRLRPDILHAHQAISAGWIGAATGFHPFLITPLGSDLLLFPRKSRFSRFLTRFTLGRADLVMAVSREMRRKAISLGVDSEKVRFARWGADLDTYRPEGDVSGLRKSLELGDSPAILSARGMKPIYNQEVVVRAMPLILQQVPEAKLMLWKYAVDESYLQKIVALIEELDLELAVRFVDRVDSYQKGADYYRLADVMVSMASSDSIPITMLESMACGTPVVITDLPSVRESIGDNENGLLVPVGDPEALASAVIRLLTDSRLQHGLRQKGLAFVREHGDHQRNMARVEEIYQRIART